MKTTLILLAILSLFFNGAGMYLNHKDKRIVPYLIGCVAFAVTILFLILSINL